jgi:beta-lactamase class A
MVNIYLPQGLPENAVFAHKTGTLDGYNHDVGILYGPKGNVFFITVLSEGDSSAFMKEVAHLTWQAMLNMPSAITSHNLVRY